MAKLHDLSGRITYISSHAKQEHLYEVYTTEPDRAFWRELAKCNQEEFEKSGTNGKCIEARELMIALPESFINYEHDYLLKKMADASSLRISSSTLRKPSTIPRPPSPFPALTAFI